MPFGLTYLVSGIAYAFEVHGTVAFLIVGFLQEAALAGSILWWVRRVDRGPFSVLGWPGFAWNDLFLGIAFGVGILLASGATNLATRYVVRLILGHMPESPAVTDELRGWATIPLTILVVAVAPICEEIFFRGFLYQGLKQRFRVGVAMIFSGAIFASIHFAPINFPGLVVGGILLAVAFDQRRSLVTSMAAHATLNAAVVALALSMR